MRNHNGQTPQEAARAQVLDMIETLAQADEDHNPYAETPSFNAAKRKHFARMYYKFAHKWKFEVGAILET